jgi:hypothetical protein
VTANSHGVDAKFAAARGIAGWVVDVGDHGGDDVWCATLAVVCVEGVCECVDETPGRSGAEFIFAKGD